MGGGREWPPGASKAQGISRVCLRRLRSRLFVC